MTRRLRERSPPRPQRCLLWAGVLVALAPVLPQGSILFLSVAGKLGVGGRSARGRSASAGRPSLQAARGRWDAAGGAIAAEALRVGDRVKARSPDDGMWYWGKIHEAGEEDGTWVVAWENEDDDDDFLETNTLTPDLIRKFRYFTGYRVGDDCMAKTPDDYSDRRWYPGVVAELLGEDMYRVKWDNAMGGDKTSQVEAEFMKRMTGVKRDYKEGDKVIARSPDDNEFYDAEVIGCNARDDEFQVRWADPGDGPETSTLSPRSIEIARIPLEKLKVGQKYQGTVTAVKRFGAFVDIGAFRSGLLDAGKIDSTKKVRVADVLKEGQVVTVWISGIHDKKFSLTMIEGRTGNARRRLDIAAFAGVPPTEWLDGTVRSVLAARGSADRRTAVFVAMSLETGQHADGFLHVTEFADYDGRESQEIGRVKVGDKVKVRIVNVDLHKNQMRVTQRPVEANSVVDIGFTV